MDIKKLGDLVPENVSATQTATSKTDALRVRYRESFKRLLPVWQAMADMYGHKWTSSYGDAVNDTWVAVCGSLKESEMLLGMKMCVQRSEERRRLGEEDWPPTAGEFRAMCRPMPYPYRNDVPALPAPSLTDEQKAQRHQDIVGLKKMLRESANEQEEARKLRLRDLWQKLKIPLGDMIAEREPGSDDDAGDPGTEDK